MIDTVVWGTPFIFQGISILVDEFYFHRKRGLTRWEKIGHPVDSLCFLVCLVFPLLFSFNSGTVQIYTILACLSCLMVTKDEWIHKTVCSGAEHWLHSILFILHPVVLIETFLFWRTLDLSEGSRLIGKLGLPALDSGTVSFLLLGQSIGTGIFLFYQIFRQIFRQAFQQVFRQVSRGGIMERITRLLTRNRPRPKIRINNRCYDELKERWYTAKDDPIALLRAESRLRNPWVASQLLEHLGEKPCRILDMGCGAGFLSNSLAEVDHDVTGIDLSSESLAVARKHDRTQRVHYEIMDAGRMSLEDASFDAVCAMDFLEHIENKEQVIQEVSRVLRPGGLFFFHTFNRTLLSRLIVIKGVEWFVKNTPENMHVYELFISPNKLRELCYQNGLRVQSMKGIRPKLSDSNFWRMLRTGNVADEFQFVFTRSMATGYVGIARKDSLGQFTTKSP